MSGRGALHARIASELTRRHGQDPRHLAAIAHHMLHAVPFDVVAAMTACRRAAAGARETSSFEASAQILSAGLSKLDHSSGNQDCQFWMLLELGEDHFHSGRGTRAWLAFRSAAESALACGNAEQLAGIAPRLTDCTDIGLGDYGFVRSVVERALAVNRELPDAVNACLLAQYAQLSVELPSAERQLLLERATQLASGSGELGAMLEVAHTCAIIRDPTRLSENARAAEHFLALVEQHPEAAAAMRYRTVRGFNAHLTLYLCALTVGDLTSADQTFERCRQLAETSHVTSAQFVVSLARAGRALGEARLVELKEVVSRGVARCDSEPSLEREAWRVYESSRVEAQGQPPNSENGESELDQLRRLTNSRFLAQAGVLRARRLAATGNALRARMVIDLVPSAVLQRMPVRYGDLGILCSLAEVRLALNELQAAEHLYEQLLPFAAFNAVGPAFDYRGSVAHFLGLIAHALGRGPTALVHFREAVAMNRRLNMPAQLGRSERQLQSVMKELEKKA
jgi:tetratricopeptide (TPR) repeat protein